MLKAILFDPPSSYSLMIQRIELNDDGDWVPVGTEQLYPSTAVPEGSITARDVTWAQNLFPGIVITFVPSPPS